MSTLYVTEYNNAAFINGVIPVAAEPQNAQQTVSIGGASGATVNAFQNNTQLIRLHTDAICSVVFGGTPVATSANRRMAANQTEYFSVPLSSGLKVAVITNS